MEQPKHSNGRGGSIRFSLATILVVALFIAGTARPAGAQSNTILGTGALGKNTTGIDNTALGFDALFENTTGDDMRRQAVEPMA
jgi:hypothetical protein